MSTERFRDNDQPASGDPYWQKETAELVAFLGTARRLKQIKEWARAKRKKMTFIDNALVWLEMEGRLVKTRPTGGSDNYYQAVTALAPVAAVPVAVAAQASIERPPSPSLPPPQPARRPLQSDPVESPSAEGRAVAVAAIKALRAGQVQKRAVCRSPRHIDAVLADKPCPACGAGPAEEAQDVPLWPPADPALSLDGAAGASMTADYAAALRAIAPPVQVDHIIPDDDDDNVAAVGEEPATAPEPAEAAEESESEMSEEWITVKEAAGILEMTDAGVRLKIRKNQLVARRPGGGQMEVKRSAVMTMKEARVAGGGTNGHSAKKEPRASVVESDKDKGEICEPVRLEEFFSWLTQGHDLGLLPADEVKAMLLRKFTEMEPRAIIVSLKALPIGRIE